jgi:hypothetical protein
MSSLRLTPSAVRRIAENRILHAIEQGDFDDLPGSGQPIPGIDQPYDPLWWVKSWIARNELASALTRRGQ